MSLRGEIGILVANAWSDLEESMDDEEWLVAHTRAETLSSLLLKLYTVSVNPEAGSLCGHPVDDSEPALADLDQIIEDGLGAKPGPEGGTR